MEYFQGVVTEYLRAKRSMFVNTECLIQLDQGDTPGKDRHWYCDAMVVSFNDSTVYLCEVTYSSTLYGLAKRLQKWAVHWQDMRLAVGRDSSIPDKWTMKPWVFIPLHLQEKLDSKFPATAVVGSQMPYPRVSYLEEVVPWKYRTWDRRDEGEEESA